MVSPYGDTELLMKHVVSVSLGSKKGDFEREVSLAGQTIRLAREGTDGDYDRAMARVAEMDGYVDAIGLGGIDASIWVAGKEFPIGDGKRLANAAVKTPVVDGSGLKNTLERQVVRELAAEGRVTAQSRVLMVSAMDRFGMAEAFVEQGCRCVFGDMIFNIGLDYPLTSLAELDNLAEKYRKRLLTVPFRMLYPTGASQDERQADPRYAKYYEEADIIAGDGHLVLRHMPPRVEGKGILTTTTRPHTLARYVDAGAAWVATTTPDLAGVSSGTNLMEAALVALMEKSPADITPSDYEEWIQRLGWHVSYAYVTGDRS